MEKYDRLKKLLTDNYILKEYYQLHYLSLVWPVCIDINSNLEYNYQPCITKIMLKGNKGEWSEIYTFLKLLSEGKLYGADGELNKKDDIF